MTKLIYATIILRLNYVFYVELFLKRIQTLHIVNFDLSTETDKEDVHFPSAKQKLP